MTGLHRLRAPLGGVAAFALILGLAGCAGSPTSSAESTARAFLEAMKANSIEAALALGDPTTGPAAGQDGISVFVLPDAEQAQVPTGVTDYEIINQTVSDDEVATVTARLTGGTIPQMTFTIGKGGPKGEDWLIWSVNPEIPMVGVEGFQMDVGSVTLAGGTVVPSDVVYLAMLPGSDFAGAVWNDDDGYLQPVPVEISGSTPGFTLESMQVTDKALPPAKAFFEDSVKAEIDRAVAPVLADASRFRVISEPSFGEWKVEKRGGEVFGTVDADLGEVEVCRFSRGFLPGSSTWTLETFNFDGYARGTGYDEIEVSSVFAPYGWQTSVFGDIRLFGGGLASDESYNPLSQCGA